MDRFARATLPLTVAVLVTLGAACGGGGGEEPAAPVTAPSPAAPVPGPTPAPTPQAYVVQPGDTLSEIAERFGTTVRALVRANDIDDPDRIHPGQELVIPSG